MPIKKCKDLKTWVYNFLNVCLQAVLEGNHFINYTLEKQKTCHRV